MSEISNKDIKKISRLAKIEVKDAQVDDLAGKLKGIIDWVEVLNEVDVSDVEPMINVNDCELRMVKDEVKDGDIADDVLSNAKLKKYQYFAVPKVIE